jgi:hypothetical protein
MVIPQLTFANLRALPINVRAVNSHALPGTTKGDFVLDPLNETRVYLKSRFMPQGAATTLQVTIEQASVIQAKQESSNKYARFFEVGGADVYDLRIRMRFEHVDEEGRLLYGQVLDGRRQMHISEHASVAEREQHQAEGLESLFRDMDREVQDLVINKMRLGM